MSDDQFAILLSRLDDIDCRLVVAANRLEAIGLDVQSIQTEQLRLRSDFLGLRNELRAHLHQHRAS